MKHQHGMTVDLTRTMIATLHPDGELTLFRNDGMARFTPEETYALLLFLRKTPGVAGLLNRAYVERARDRYTAEMTER